jgi:hypothetical protein
VFEEILADFEGLQSEGEMKSKELFQTKERQVVLNWVQYFDKSRRELPKILNFDAASFDI